MTSKDLRSLFTVGRNPQDDSKLPFLLRLPLDGGLVTDHRSPTAADAIARTAPAGGNRDFRPLQAVEHLDEAGVMVLGYLQAPA